MLGVCGYGVGWLFNRAACVVLLLVSINSLMCIPLKDASQFSEHTSMCFSPIVFQSRHNLISINHEKIVPTPIDQQYIKHYNT